MRTRLAFYDPRNHPPKRPHDGDEFRKFALQFAPGLGTVNAENAGMVISTINFIVQHRYQPPQSLDQIGFFCHGWSNRLSLWSPTLSPSRNAQQLAEVIKPILKSDGTIGLFACRTAESLRIGTMSNDEKTVEMFEPGFASYLSRYLPTVTVMAHDFPAHTVRNPHDVLFLDGKRIYSYPDPRNYMMPGSSTVSLVDHKEVLIHRRSDGVQDGWTLKPELGICENAFRWAEAYKAWCDWERSDKGGQRGLSLITVEGWKAAEVATGLKLRVG